jgi:hypothetical protein
MWCYRSTVAKDVCFSEETLVLVRESSVGEDELMAVVGSGLPKYVIPDALAIPGSFSLLSSQYQKSRYDGLMKKLVEGIAVTEISGGALEVVSEAGQAISGHGAVLYQSLSGPLQEIGTSGVFRGVFYGAGKITEHAAFVPVGAMGAASSCAAMVILLTIAIEVHEIKRVLDEVKQSIDNVKELLHNDRIGEIIAGMYQFQQALELYDDSKKQDLLVHSVQMLNEGIVKAIISLKNEIQDVPESATKLKNVLRVSKMREEAWHKMGLAEDTLGIILYGIQAMAECYSLLDEPSAAAHSLRTSISALGEVGLEEAIVKSRMLPYNGTILPESPWVSFKENAPSALNVIESLQSLGSVGQTGFELEVVKAVA